MRLLLDEMYSAVHAEALQAVGVEAATVIEFGLAGSADPEVFAAAIAEGSTLLTENVADFARISAEHLTTGQHHPGVLIALSSRFSRRPAGIPLLVAAIRDIADQQLADCLIYLQQRTELVLADLSQLGGAYDPPGARSSDPRKIDAG